MTFPKTREFFYRLFQRVGFKVRPNNVGVHFVLSLKPIHIVAFDIYIFRLNIFWPLFISISGGLRGHKGFQVYAGIKWDPTSQDYLFSAALRIHLLGTEANINSQASL